MKQETEILIIGAGVPGLALAQNLTKAGFSVLVVDRSPAPRFDTKITDGRTAAIMVEALTRLEKLGVQDLDTFAPLKALRLIDPEAQPEIDMIFNASEIGLDYYGRNVPVLWLRTQLMKGIENKCLFETALEKLDVFPTFIEATLSSGIKIETQLIVGADGSNSSVRTLSNIDLWQHDYQQSAITCILSHSLQHNDTSTEFHYAGGPFTLVPLTGKRSALVWLERTDQCERILKLSKDSFIQKIQKLSNGVLGRITLETPPHSWPVRTSKANALTSDRVILIAEAAHVVPPTGAQGLNLSLRDAFELHDILTTAIQRGEDIGSAGVLDRYVAKRTNDIDARLKATDALNRFILTSGFAGKALKRNSMRLFSAPSVIRRLVMRQGLAPETRSLTRAPRIKHKH